MQVWFAILLADVVLVVHFLIAAFNILALPATVLGLAMGWQFARNRFFRLAHLVCMGVVLLFAALGRYCPLTDWESALRIAAGQEGYETSFIAHWLSRLLYVDADLRVLAVLYALWTLTIVVLWFLAPPRLRRSDRDDISSPG
ncbi:Protein of unknown function DUF2784 [Alkalidesulfovibrio alkalitolerans DSM 16529]|jgi:hypothetical protein|uniref:DUF2784 domain-containing protein n=1 Tax=Alkalidesulfovibrio alkalitolerans DSM 16529 TaxID=1121439 RepID=S7U9M4_9BACT|nr:DUF2784 domain-containing protein [Alkalidesulfovibrio alkalitolerans]EPR30639.1 Protein of unknown function DUF2784 [Alkalidesulfovibrio alkalitolerans DSM 16529]